VAKYNSLGKNESVAQECPPKEESTAAVTQPEPEPQPEAQAIIIAPAPSVETPAPTTETAQNTEAPQPQPKQLPRTASPLELIGLIGLASMSGSLIRFFRG
jgi:hypothetical protein